MRKTGAGMVDPLFVFWMARIRKALRREFETHAAALDITASQFHVLYRLWQGDGIPTTVLAREAASDGSTMTGVLDRLEDKGLLRRERSREDRRTVHVYLTPTGRELESPLRERLAQLNEQALLGLTPEARTRLMESLAHIGGNLGA